MFKLLESISSSTTRAMRWIITAWFAITLIGSAMAQSTTEQFNFPGQAQGQSIQVKQTLWIDESRLLDFGSVRAQSFKPFNPFERLNLGNKVAWLRLNIERLDIAAGPFLLHLIPAHIGDVTLYSPSTHAPNTWNQRVVSKQELISTIKLGELVQGDNVYLKIESRNNVSIIAFVGQRDELNQHEAKLAVMMTFVSTLTLVAFLAFVWRAIRYFSWMSVLISALLMSYQIYYLIGMGYAYSILGLPLEMGIVMVTPNVIANFAIAGGILVLIGCALFPNQRWLNWLWTWSLLHLCLFVYAFFQPSTASSLSMTIWIGGPVILGAFLTIAAFKEPTSLRLLSSKVAFGLLLMTCLILGHVAFKSGDILGSLSNELTTDLFIKSISTRFPQLLVIIVLSSWIFERIRANQLNNLSGELQKSKESLEMESKRLDRQRKFTAMLAHELKNPLAVSHMALSGIETRLGTDDPLLERAAAIKQSLQDIDAIIDRCSEIDGFEQGELPMNLGTFSLNYFLGLLKDANTNERIYFLKRGVHDDTILNSDIQYLKIIFNNLLSNALKYSPPDTLIELSILSKIDEQGNKAINFCVSNEVGEAGTPAADRAFERFYRAEAARNQSGAGLGLWLSQELAHALGSEVVMQNDGDSIKFSMSLAYV